MTIPTSSPAPTNDGVRAEHDLVCHGYCVLTGALDEETTVRLRASVEQTAHEERAAGTQWVSNGNQKSFMLLNRAPEFLALAEHPVAIAFAKLLLGPHPLLSSLVANLVRSGNRQQQLHADQEYVPHPWARVAAMNVVWAMDNFDATNGATVVAPGTHLLGRPPDGSSPELVPILAPAGSAIVLDGRVWHAAGRNRTRATVRIGVLAHYCAPYIRQQENVFRSLEPTVLDRLTPNQRHLLGYDVWSGLGVVNGPPREWAESAERTGPTNADALFDRS